MTKLPEKTSSKELLNSLSFVVFDLETTGGNHKSDKIIEIGMTKIENLEITDNLSFLINPEIKIPEFIQKLTSISPKDLVDSLKIEEAIDQILDFMGDSILVAHNASFDVPFFNSVLRRLGRAELENRSICTNLMTKYLIPEIMNSNLNYMSKIFDIEHSKAHRAQEDATATAKLFLKFLAIFIEKDIQKINQLYYPRNKFELDRIHFKPNTDIEIISTKLENIKTAFTLSFKGEKGVLIFFCPIMSYEKEKDFILKALKEIDYKTLTIKMIGSFYEGFLSLNINFPKMEQDCKNLVLNHLYNELLDKKSSLEDDIDMHSIPDFLICPHLIPEQYTLYTLKNLHPKNFLIFRYPAHKKKFNQFVGNQINRIKSKKKKKNKYIIHKELEHFYFYLIKNFLTNSERSFLFNVKDFNLNNKSFESSINDFFNKNADSNNYPKEHI